MAPILEDIRYKDISRVAWKRTYSIKVYRSLFSLSRKGSALVECVECYNVIMCGMCGMWNVECGMVQCVLCT